MRTQLHDCWACDMELIGEATNPEGWTGHFCVCKVCGQVHLAMEDGSEPPCDNPNRIADFGWTVSMYDKPIKR